MPTLCKTSVQLPALLLEDVRKALPGLSQSEAIRVALEDFCELRKRGYRIERAPRVVHTQTPTTQEP